MKKILFFAAAAVAVMTSCSSSDDVITEGPAPIVNGLEEDETPQLIQLSANSGILSTSTRGSGTVGDVTTANNTWDGQDFNVYMFKRGTLKDTIYKNEIFYAGLASGMNIDGKDIFNGIATASTDSISIIRPKNDLVQYYPAKGAFDFYAYRLDSANYVSGTLNVPDTTATGDSLNVEFKIDGSQDIMVAYADTTTADIDAIMTAANITADRDSAAARFFSAYTSRKNIIPTLFFKHLLTRLTFQIIPGTDEAVAATNGVRVDSIKVMSKTEGKLTIAPLDKQGITNWAAEDSLSLKQRPAAGLDSLNLEDFAQYTLIGKTKGTAYPVGEALLVKPGETSYQVSVFLSQEVKNSYSGTTAPANRLERYEIPTVIELPGNAEFLAGKSYTVKITVNGLREIVLKAALDNWKEGETIERNPEDEDFEY